MKANFAPSLTALLAHEGGYSNHPADNGHATNKGVTQAVYDAFRSRNHEPLRWVKAITSTEVAAIYRAEYWDRIKGDDLPSGVDYAVFDFAVNSGTNRAARFLQRCVGAATDGSIGPRTIALVGANDPASLIDALSDMRLKFLRDLPDFAHFGNGWSDRVADVRLKAKGMAHV